MEDVGLKVIGGEHEVAHDSGVRRRGHMRGGVQGQHGGHAMGHRTDPANPFGKVLGVPGVPVYQDGLKSPKERSRGSGIHHLLNSFDLVYGDLDFEVAFQPGYGIDDLDCGH